MLYGPGSGIGGSGSGSGFVIVEADAVEPNLDFELWPFGGGEEDDPDDDAWVPSEEVPFSPAAERFPFEADGDPVAAADDEGL